MSQEKAKELRQMEKDAVKLLYEVKTQVFSNGTVMVTANDDKAINDPLLFTSIQLDSTRVVVERWKKQRQKMQDMAKDDGQRIIH